MSYETMVGIIFATASLTCAYIAFQLKLRQPFKTIIKTMFFLFSLMFLVSGFGSAIQVAEYRITDINDTYVQVAGDTMTGNLTLEDDLIIEGTIFGGSPVKLTGGLNMNGTLNVDGSLNVIGGTMTSNLSMGNSTIKSYYGLAFPNYDSGWVAFSQGEFKTLTHNLSGDVNNYFIDIMANDSSDGGTGLNNVYHGLNKEGVTNIRRGFYWFNLNTTSVTVYRGTHDARAPNIKVRIWKMFNSDDDARVTLGSGNSSEPLIDDRSYLFVHTDAIIPVTIAGTWYNITFDKHECTAQGITHNYDDETNDTFIIQKDGIYDLHGHFSIQDSAALPSSNTAFRFLRNNVEISGSAREKDLDKKDWDTLGSVTVFTELAEGDEIKFQFTSDVTTVSLVTDGNFVVHGDSAVVKIKRVG